MNKLIAGICTTLLMVSCGNDWNLPGQLSVKEIIMKQNYR